MNTPELRIIKMPKSNKVGLAVGRKIANGFLVYAGSHASLSLSENTLTTNRPTYVPLRDALIKAKVLRDDGIGHYVFTQDFLFSSPSAAASVVMGMGVSGNAEWKPIAKNTQ